MSNSSTLILVLSLIRNWFYKSSEYSFQNNRFFSLFLGRKFIYIIPVVIVGYLYSQSIAQGLIPTDNISFAGHFGGLVGGVVLGYVFNKKNRFNFLQTQKNH